MTGSRPSKSPMIRGALARLAGAGARACQAGSAGLRLTPARLGLGLLIAAATTLTVIVATTETACACLSPEQVTGRLAKQAADLALPRWSLDHPTETCPPGIEALERYVAVSAEQLVDAWGRPLVLLCSARRTRVVSAGPDGKIGTADDIGSDD